MIKYYKLRSGDEIMGEVVTSVEGEDKDFEVSYDLERISHPWRLLVAPQGGYALQPIPVKSIDIDSNTVLFSGEVDEDLANAYREKLGGVVQARRPSLVTP